MRQFIASFLIFLVLGGSPLLAISPEEKVRAAEETHKALKSVERPSNEMAPSSEITALDWHQMSLTDRMNYLVIALSILSANGIAPERSPNEYCDRLSDKLKTDPSLYAMSLTNFLAAYIYETEPKSRAVLDQFRRKNI